jgi:hypothetical protein
MSHYYYSVLESMLPVAELVCVHTSFELIPTHLC